MKTLHEIFTEIQEAPTRAERQDIINENDSFTLRTVLQLNFDKTIELDLPAGKPPYKCKDKATDKPDSLLKGLGNCVKNSRLPGFKKEVAFINILENLTEEDANIICLAKDGKIMKKYSRVSESLIKSIYPSLVK